MMHLSTQGQAKRAHVRDIFDDASAKYSMQISYDVLMRAALFLQCNRMDKHNKKR